MEKAGKKIRAAFDGLRNLQSHSQRNEIEIKEMLGPDDFAFAEIVRHGFPCQPTCLAFDPVQKLLAIGTEKGAIRILGRPGVDAHLRRAGESKVEQIHFLINEGALISLCADDCVHLWNFRQHRPEVVHSLQFQKERLTTMHLPFQSKWLYLGTERGNVHVVSIETFSLSGYVINWNKAIDLSQKNHPGTVVHLSGCPNDENKLLIGYDRGTIVLWDLKLRQAEARFQCEQSLRSVCWHYEGRQFICAHGNGSLTTWSTRKPGEPLQVAFPHSRGKNQQTPDAAGTPVNVGAPGASQPAKGERLRPIQRVEWKHQKGGEEFIVFSGGMPQDDAGSQPCVTVLRGKYIAVLEMEHPIVSFLTFCESPYSHDAQDPYALAVLLKNDLVIVDLTKTGYPCFENPYPMDVHESPVTCIAYVTDCPTDLISAYYSVGSKQKRQGYSDKGWPIRGGELGASPSSFSEIVVTGHADGSLKFWDSSSVNLQVLYKLKPSKALERPDAALPYDTDPFAVQHVCLCPDSRQLAIGCHAGHVMMFKFSRQENSTEIVALEVVVGSNRSDEADSESDVKQKNQASSKQQPELKRQRSVASMDSASSGETDFGKNSFLPVKVKGGPQKRPSGYQPELVCLTVWSSLESPETITALALNSAYGLLAYGTEKGLAIVDVLQHICVICMSSAELYGGDPYQRTQAKPLTPGLEKHPSSDPEVVNSPVEKHENCQQSSSEAAQSPTTGLRYGSGGNRLVTMATLGGNQACGVGVGGKPNATLGGKASSLAERTKSQGSPLLRRPFLKAQSLASVDDGGGHFDFTHASAVSVSGFAEKDKELSRSRSSSTSSVDLIGAEGVCSLCFIDCYKKKLDASGPTLWVGTTQGSAVAISLKISTSVESRLDEPVVAVPTGMQFRSRGLMLCMGFLDCNGSLLLPAADSWKENAKEPSLKNRVVTKTKICSKPSSANGGVATISGVDHRTSFDNDQASSAQQQTTTGGGQPASEMLAVLCLDKIIKVYSTLTLSRLFTLKLTVQLLRAEIIVVNGAPVVAGYGVNGRLYVYSLPSLRPLSDTVALPANDLRVMRTLRFSFHGHGVYMCSPSELQKFTILYDVANQKDRDVHGELFIPCNMPEPPKQNFLKELFGSGNRSLDREELFGESSGKASKSVARRIPGGGNIDSLRGQSSGATSEVMKARLALNERGEKLSEVEEKTQMLLESSKVYSEHTNELMNKYKNKKWYQF